LPETAPIRVVVADDAALIRSGLVRLLTGSGFEVIAEADDHESLITAIDRDPPDLVITDIPCRPTIETKALEQPPTSGPSTHTSPC
jgi:DNA-binding NarL/FixJ family response regulator